MLATFGLLLSSVAMAQAISMPSPDAKTLSMGGVEMTTLAGSHTIYNNMAMAAFGTQSFQLSSSYNRWEGIDYYTVTGSTRITGSTTLQAGWRNYRRSSDNRDMTADLGISQRFGENVAIGITGRYMRLTRPATTEDALDLGASVALRGDTDLGDYGEWRAGARVDGLGGFINRDGSKQGHSEKLPLRLTVGAALDTHFNDSHQITVAADCGYSFEPSSLRGFNGSVGAEYNLMQLFQLRAGYHLAERNSYTSCYGSVGCGVRFLHLRLDFAYLLASKSSPLHNMYSLSFGLDF